MIIISFFSIHFRQFILWPISSTFCPLHSCCIRAACWVAAIATKKKHSIVRHSHRVVTLQFFFSSGSFSSCLRCDEQTTIESVTFLYFRFVFWQFIYKFAALCCHHRKNGGGKPDTQIQSTCSMHRPHDRDKWRRHTHTVPLSTVWIGKKKRSAKRQRRQLSEWSCAMRTHIHRNELVTYC